MTFSMVRFQAIVKKEWKDAVKNPQILLLAALPILFALVFEGMADNRLDIISYPALLALSMTGAFTQSTMVCEEKEKHTLRVLMLSPATVAEILLGKSLLTALLTLVVMIISMIIVGFPVYHFAYLALMLLFSLVMFLSFGTIIGLLSRTVSESSIIGLPVLLIFVMGPFFAPDLGGDALVKIVDYLPTQQFMHALSALTEDGGFNEIKWNLLNIAVWTAASLVVCLVTYNKRRFDK
ncbi:ABC transporter permease [Paenibacillus nanensis]|uniref:ABC transporter permease n=1 Tax=Paenibacillus nanensis TaxID=393251 RepID=A0A3A1UQL5_9BACL|nr:ABC transporter permease [Paenibacillus nanensis]RIX49262.1 ABC transporter permease [Paenibacillus nanensis]